MKTQFIKTPTAELLVVELPEDSTLKEIFELIGAVENNSLNYHLTVYNFSDYTLLGKTDEITEEDAAQLIPMYFDYERTAVEYLIEMIESEIYWENPIKVHTWASENADIYYKQWHEAELRTFDKSRTLIFVKN